MADNRISFFNQLNQIETGRWSAFPRTLQQARAEMARFRDVFRANLQDTSTNPDADDTAYRVSNIQEFGRLSSGSIWSFVHCFIIRHVASNREWMIMFDQALFNWTTGAFSNVANFTLANILNGGTASWANDLGVSYNFNSATPQPPQNPGSASWSWCEMWLINNQDYATSTFGGSWEYPTFATAYTLDFIRPSSFGANIIAGDPASAGPNPALAAGAGFDNWWPAGFATKNCHFYSTNNWEASQASNKNDHIKYWIFDKVENDLTFYSMHPYNRGYIRMVNIGENFDTFANGGVANSGDTKRDSLVVIDIKIDNTSLSDSSNTNSVRRCSGFRGDGVTRDNAMILALNGDRTPFNYKNGSDEIFTRKVAVSNGFTTKGFLKPSFILEGGVNTTINQWSRGHYLINKILEYPDADNPMLWLGCSYFLKWKNNVGSLHGLSVPGLP